MKHLSKEQKKFYDENGYIVLDILSDQDVDELSAEYDDIFYRKRNENMEATWKGDWNKSSDGEVKSIHGLQLHSAAFTRLLLHEKLLDACEDVMGSPNVLLHHTKAHLKPPGTGSPFPMHQDYHYFPYKNDSLVAVFISIDGSYKENGGLCVYPGSHRLGPQKDAASVEGYHYLDPEEFPIEKASSLTLKRGQVVIFSYLLIHGSYDNNSSRPRRMFLVQLVSADDEPLTDLHKSPCQGLVLRGRNTSKRADITRRHENACKSE